MYESFFFDVTEDGTYLATLEDLANPVPSEYLQLNIYDPTSTLLGTTLNASNQFTFLAAAGTNYIAQVLGIGGDFQGIQVGNWKVQITQQVPIPEPGVWLTMAGGIALLGWLRMRKSEHFG